MSTPPCVVSTLQGTLRVPGDKSISHRALMLLALCNGTGVIENLSPGQDVASTARCLRQLGVEIHDLGDHRVEVTGRLAFKAPTEPLDCGNSGTTMRLLAGLLTGAGIPATLIGDDSLSRRPMKRILDPLIRMGGTLTAQGDSETLPLVLATPPQTLGGLDAVLPMASAQVKSAILLAGLFASQEARVCVQEPLPSRDHTERMLAAFGAAVETVGNRVTLLGRVADLKPRNLVVPGDISSAAFWLVGAAILPGSRLVLQNVGLNPTRTGILDVLAMAGATVTRTEHPMQAGEPWGNLTIVGGTLSGDITISADMIPALIDEIPVLTVLGLFTDGRFTVEGAEELRYKESDRLGAMICTLTTLGVAVDTLPAGFSFRGDPAWVPPAVSEPLETHHDHRLVMALEILNCRASSPLPIAGRDWVAVSYPGFYAALSQLKTPGPA